MLIPIVFKDDDRDAMTTKLRDLAATLKSHGVRVYIDDRENYNPGWKFNNWEMKGVPLRIELGKNDMAQSEVKVVRRDDGTKQQVKWEALGNFIPSLLEQIHEDMYARALKTRDDHIAKVNTWAEFMSELNKRNLCLAPWCNDQECEKAAKERSKVESLQLAEQGEEEEVLTGAAKTLCIPFE